MAKPCDRCWECREIVLALKDIALTGRERERERSKVGEREREAVSSELDPLLGAD